MSWQTWRAGLEPSTLDQNGQSLPLEPALLCQLVKMWAGVMERAWPWVMSSLPLKHIMKELELITGGRWTSPDASGQQVFPWRQQISKTSKDTSEMECLCDKICVLLTLAHKAKLSSNLVVLFTPVSRCIRIFSCFTSMLTLGIVCCFHFSCFGGSVML